MTAIVAISWDGGALLAGDGSGCVQPIDLQFRERTPKVARRQGYLVGAAGDAVACMCVLHGLDVAYNGGGLGWWAHTHFVPQLRDALDGAKSGDDAPSATALLAAPGELVLVDDVGGAVSIADGYMAIGSGGLVALGALAVLRRGEPLSRARRALRAATRHAVSVSRPWSYVTASGEAGLL